MGLALSRKTVLDHGGDMWTESAVGARFRPASPNRKSGNKVVGEIVKG